jgi:hypothetical protein
MNVTSSMSPALSRLFFSDQARGLLIDIVCVSELSELLRVCLRKGNRPDRIPVRTDSGGRVRAVWEYRWREPGPDGARRHRRIVVGPVSRFGKREDALRAISALQRDINHAGKRQVSSAITIRELFDHYCQRELRTDNAPKTASTKHAYEGYITKRICPRWGSFPSREFAPGRSNNGFALFRWRLEVAPGSVTSRAFQPRHSTRPL